MRDLLVNLMRYRLRVVLQHTLAQCVAALIIFERAGMVARILQRLAQREAQVDPVLDIDPGAGFLRDHHGQFGIAEPIGLEIGEAPIGIAKIGPGGIALAVGVHCGIDPAQRFERMAIGQADRGIIRTLLLQPGIFRHRVFGPANVQHQVGALHRELRVGRFQRGQFFGFTQRGIVFEALVQHFGIVEPGVEIIGIEHLAAFKDEFGILIFTQPRAKFGQQPHRHRIIGNFQQIGANPLFGELVILIIIGRKRPQHFGRMAFNVRNLVPQRAGLDGIGRLMMRGQQFERGSQQRVELHRPRIGGNRRVALVLLAIAVAAFLPGPAELGTQRQKSVKQAMGSGKIAPRTGNDCCEIEHFGIIAAIREQPRCQQVGLRHIAARQRQLGINKRIGLHGSRISRVQSGWHHGRRHKDGQGCANEDPGGSNLLNPPGPDLLP